MLPSPDKTSVSLFGKLPSSLDFVRINHHCSAASALDEWMQASVRELARRGASWPAAALRFLFTPAKDEFALLGVLAPSCDRARRNFPVAIFASYPQALLARYLRGIVKASTSFLDASEALLVELQLAQRSDVQGRVEALVPPHVQAIQAAYVEVGPELEKRPAHSFLDAVFQASPEPDALRRSELLPLALSTFHPSSRHHAEVVQLPIADADDVAVWLEIGVRTRSLPLSTSMLWTLGRDPKLFLCSGMPPSALTSVLSHAAAPPEQLVLRAPAPAADGARGRREPDREPAQLTVAAYIAGLAKRSETSR